MSQVHVHTRTIDLDVFGRPAGGLRLEAKLCDLRRLTFVSLVQGGPVKSGLIHDVELDLAVDSERMITESRFRMYTVPFTEAGESGGQLCRDIEPAFDRLAGIRVDGDYTRAVVARVGGPRGCFHGQALAIGAGPVIKEAFAGATEGAGVPAYSRHLLVDAYNYGDHGVSLLGRMQDSRAEASSTGPGPGRIVREVELEVFFEVTDFQYRSVVGNLREDSSGETGDPDYRLAQVEIGATASGLEGLRLGPGVFAEASRRLGSSAPARRLFQLLSMMIPVTTQAVLRQLARQERPLLPAGGASLAQTDSCHMWVRGGPLEKRVAKAYPDYRRAADRLGKGESRDKKEEIDL